MKILKGFTLIELLIYMGLMALLFTVLTNIFLSVLDSQQESVSSSATDIDGRYLIARLAYDIRQAAGITTPAAAGDTSSLLVLNSHSYLVSDGVLYMDSVNRLTSPDTIISGFSVTRTGNPSGKHTLTIDFTLTAGQQTKDYHLSVGLR